MTGYDIVPSLQRATINDYVKLFNNSFAGDGKLNEQYLGWQYLQNPHGQVIGSDAYVGDQLAAHYAIIPRRYRIGSQVFSAALSVNTATHPEHQGNGLFVRLAERTYEEATSRGLQFVIGAANANSIGGFTRRLGFSTLGQSRLFLGFSAQERPVNALDLAVDCDWLAWRLANPSRAYERLNHADGSCTVRTRVKGIPFNLGRVEAALLQPNRLVAPITEGNAFLPALTPLFTGAPTSGVRLPLRVQPSPWHVIWRSLSPECDMSLALHLRLDGLGMDTF